MINRRKTYFPDNDVTVITGLLPNGEYGAYREDEDEGHVRGFGHSRWSATADLVEWIEAHKYDVVEEEIEVIEREAA